MFIGHFAVAFAAKRATPATSLGTLCIACAAQLPAIACAGLAGGAATAALGYWIDRHRTMKA